MSRAAARSTILATAPVRLGEETLTPEELADAEKQEAARALLSRRSHSAAKIVDALRLLVEQTPDTDAAELGAFAQALTAARQGRDLVVAAFNAARVS